MRRIFLLLAFLGTQGCAYHRNAHLPTFTHDAGIKDADKIDSLKFMVESKLRFTVWRMELRNRPPAITVCIDPGGSVRLETPSNDPVSQAVLSGVQDSAGFLRVDPDKTITITVAL
ncbi:hypothetical protein HON52_00025 [Candidatus Uhrbacteria bacterium]|jgi:hypothetical protein|nr:hypothetical protein [Candidatus Uhrbacteria bacterium]